MNLMTHFNYRLSIMAQLGYQKSVVFNLGAVSLHSTAGSPVRVGEGGTASSPKPFRLIQQRKKRQIQRTNRVSDSPNPFLPSWGES